MRPCRPPARLGFEWVDEVGIEEAAMGTGVDAGAGDRDGEMAIAGSGDADQDDVALMGKELAASEIAREGLVGRRAVEAEVLDVFGQQQLGDGDLVLDRARLLLGDLGLQQVATIRRDSCCRLTAVVMISSKAAFMPKSLRSTMAARISDRSITPT